MKSTITTGDYTKDAGHSYRHSTRKLIVDEEPPRRESVESGLDRFCRKYRGAYCLRCKVESCDRRTTIP